VLLGVFPKNLSSCIGPIPLMHLGSSILDLRRRGFKESRLLFIFRKWKPSFLLKKGCAHFLLIICVISRMRTIEMTHFQISWLSLKIWTSIVLAYWITISLQNWLSFFSSNISSTSAFGPFIWIFIANFWFNLIFPLEIVWWMI